MDEKGSVAGDRDAGDKVREMAPGWSRLTQHNRTKQNTEKSAIFQIKNGGLFYKNLYSGTRLWIDCIYK